MSAVETPAEVAAYASTAADYLAAGWNPIPVDSDSPKGKSGIPSGVTGYKGRAVDAADVKRWSNSRGRDKIALRMPPGVVGFDVDQYDDKHGDDELQALEAELGALPPTWASSNRPGTRSGIYFYRVPPGLRFPTEPCADVEFIQPHHRYAVVWPSVHKEGRTYRWYDDAGEESDRIPAIDDLTELPWAWVEHFQRRHEGVVGDAATTERVAEFVKQHTAAQFPKALKGPISKLDGASGSRHDSLLEVACWTMREAAADYYPAGDAIKALERWWNATMDDTDRLHDTDGNGITEFGNAIAWAVGQADRDPDRIEKLRAELTKPMRPPNVDENGVITHPQHAVEGCDRGTADPQGTIESLPGLPDEFWDARPVLAHIREAARARRVAPTAVLGCVLARVAAFTPPTIAIPPLVGAAVPLSTYVALMSPTGGSKSTPVAVARDLLPVVLEGVVGPLPLGSGEGVANAYLESVEVIDDDGKKVRVRKQTRHGALFMLDEARVLSEMAGRRGATIIPTLCTAWTGGDLGQANASADTFRHVEASGYSLGLIAAWQPVHAQALFDDTEGGLPGRFLFLPTADTDAPDERPYWPGKIDWSPPSFCRWATSPGELAHVTSAWLDVPTVITDEVDAERLAILRSEHIPHPLDAHSTLKRLKVAGVFATLDDRPDVTVDDWELARQLVAVSDAVRDSVLGHLRVEAHRREAAATERVVKRAEALAESAEGRAFRAAARAVARKAHRHVDETLPRRLLTQAVKGTDRALVDLDRVLDHAVGEGWIEAVEDGYRAGRSTPA